MFDYPLFLSRDTLYNDLLVEPDALPNEIREAKIEATVALDQERAALEREMQALESAVPGLAAARQAVKSAEAKTETEPHALVEAQAQLAKAEARALQVNPDYREILRKKEDINSRKIDINKITIDNPEARKAYDAGHPPLGLMKIEDAARDGFVDNKTSIGLLRRELSQFIASQDEEVFYPSDLYREDFSNDFTPHRLLDG